MTTSNTFSISYITSSQEAHRNKTGVGNTAQAPNRLLRDFRGSGDSGTKVQEVVLGSGYEAHSLGLKIVGPTSYKTGPCGPPYFYSLTIEQSQKNGECGCWEKCGHSLATVMRLRRPFCHRGMADCHRPHNRCLSKDQPTNHPTIQPK